MLSSVIQQRLERGSAGMIFIIEILEATSPLWLASPINKLREKRNLSRKFLLKGRRKPLSQRIFDAKVAKKGQIVIPKALRERFRIKESSRVTLVPTEEGVLIRPAVRKPWTGLRGLIKGALTIEELDRLLEEAKRSLLEAK